jgi:hypothetical protein
MSVLDDLFAARDLFKNARNREARDQAAISMAHMIDTLQDVRAEFEIEPDAPAGRSFPRDTGRDASYPEDPDDASDRAAYTALGRRAFPRPNPRDVSGGNGTEFS